MAISNSILLIFPCYWPIVLDPNPGLELWINWLSITWYGGSPEWPGFDSWRALASEIASVWFGT